MIQVLKRIANTSVNTFPLPIMSIRPLLEEIWTSNAKWFTNDVPRQERFFYKLKKKCVVLTLSRLGPRLDRVLSFVIHVSPNNGVINTVQSGKLVVNVLAMHCALWIIIFGLLLVTIWYHYISGWFVRVSLALKAQAYFCSKFEIELQ